MTNKAREEMTAKAAVIYAIWSAMRERNLEKVELEGYEDDTQRVRFTLAGEKVSLLGMERPNLQSPMVTLSVRLERDPEGRTCIIRRDVSRMRYGTLERICNEIYDEVRDSADPEYDFWFKDVTSGFYDTYNARRA